LEKNGPINEPDKREDASINGKEKKKTCGRESGSVLSPPRRGSIPKGEERRKPTLNWVTLKRAGEKKKLQSYLNFAKTSHVLRFAVGRGEKGCPKRVQRKSAVGDEGFFCRGERVDVIRKQASEGSLPITFHGQGSLPRKRRTLTANRKHRMILNQSTKKDATGREDPREDKGGRESVAYLTRLKEKGEYIQGRGAGSDSLGLVIANTTDGEGGDRERAERDFGLSRKKATGKERNTEQTRCDKLVRETDELQSTATYRR